jgi:hypothetical protein
MRGYIRDNLGRAFFAPLLGAASACMLGAVLMAAGVSATAMFWIQIGAWCTWTLFVPAAVDDRFAGVLGTRSCACYRG